MWNFKKNGSSTGLAFDSPFRDAYEIRVPDPAPYPYTSLAAMNGDYSFEATNAEGKTDLQSFTWDFSAVEIASHQPFTESWGENIDKNERNEAEHYTRFEYSDGRVWATMKPFVQEGTTIAYGIMYARYARINSVDIGPNDNPLTRPDAYRLSRVAGGFSQPFTPGTPTDPTPITMDLWVPNVSDNDYAQVALVAFKRVMKNDDEDAGTVMMRTEYKTIRNGMNYFMEDAPEF
jgi:hypothetical protein